MTTTTNVGLEYLSDLAFGNETAPMDTIAVGTGDAAESSTDTSLSNEVYRSSESSEITFLDMDADGVYEAIITLKGGTQIPGGTQITETGVIVGTNDTLIVRDTHGAITVESGHTVEFTVEISFL